MNFIMFMLTPFLALEAQAQLQPVPRRAYRPDPDDPAPE
jgi:hypothetical protein